MEVLENLLEVQPALGPELVKCTNVLEWLLRRVGAPTFDANKLYASELLGVLVNGDSGIQSEFDKLHSSRRGNDGDEDEEGGIDLILRACAIYRRNSAEPRDDGEAEVRACACLYSMRGRYAYGC